MGVNYCSENHGGNCYHHVKQQQDKQLLRRGYFRCCHAFDEHFRNKGIKGTAKEKQKHRNYRISTHGDCQDVFHVNLILQGLVFGIKAHYGSGQAKIHDRKIGNKRSYELVQAIFTFANEVQKNWHIGKAYYRMENDIQITD